MPSPASGADAAGGATLALPPGFAARGFALRPVAEGDRDFLQHLFRTIRGPEFAALPWSEEVRSAFLNQQRELQHRHYATHYPDAEFLLLLHESRPIGRLTIDRQPDDLRLMDIGLLPEWRGRGLGLALLRLLQDEALAAGRATVSLDVDPLNPARRLYARAGFAEQPQDEPRASITMIWTAPLKR